MPQNDDKGEYFMAEKKVMLTEDGYNKLVEKLNYLKSVRRIEVAERLKAAIALGDLSENSEYDDAKNEQAFLEGEIQELETKIRNSDIIKAGDGKTVTMGSRVTVKDLEFDEDETFLIVGSTEADPDEGKDLERVAARHGFAWTTDRTCGQCQCTGRADSVQDHGYQEVRSRDG